MMVFVLLTSVCLDTTRAFNVKSIPFQVIKGEKKDHELGTSIALVKDKIFIGAPKSFDGKGMIYSCSLKGTLQTERSIDTCKELPIKRKDDPSSFTETNQGLGAHLFLNPAKTRLLYCSPRLADVRPYTCRQPYIGEKSFIRLQGECVEHDTDTLGEISVKNWCSNTWHKPGNMPFFGKELSCTQIQLKPATTARFIVELTDGTPKEITMRDSNDQTNFKIDSETYSYCNATYQVLITLWQKTAFKVRCSIIGSEITSETHTLAFDVRKVKAVSVSNVERFRDYSYNEENKEVDLMSCMLGVGAVYFDNTDLHIASPGYKNYEGAIFRDDGKAKFSPESVKFAGKTHVGIKFKQKNWEAITSIVEPKSTLHPNRVKVDIIKDNLHLQSINETIRFEGFGNSMLYYVQGDSLYLFIGRPYAIYKGIYDCGMIDIFKYETSQFEVVQANFTGVCGRFGSDMVIIGAFTGNPNTPQIAITAPTAQKVVILDLVDDTFEVMQVIGANGTLFGYAVSGHDNVEGENMLAIADPLESKVYLYKTLDIVRLSMGVSCSPTFNIMSFNSTFSCNIRFTTQEPRTLADTLTIGWEVKNNTLKDYITTQKQLDKIPITDVPITVKFELSQDLTAAARHAWDLNVDLPVEFKADYHDINLRTVAFDPKQFYKPVLVYLDVQSYCGDSNCVADFEIKLVDKAIHRINTTTLYRELEGSQKLETFHFYKGSGVELVNLTFDIVAKTGKILNEHAQVNVSDGLLLQNLTTIAKTGTVWRQNAIIKTFTNLGNTAEINISVPLGQNHDPDVTNNAISLSIPCSTLIDIDSFLELQPSNMPHDRYSLSNFPKTNTENLGPSQDMTIGVVNNGQSVVDLLSLKILYPIAVSKKEVFYITKISGSQKFWCDDITNKQINYKNVPTPNEDKADEEEGKLKNLQLVDCGKDVLCLEMVCSFQDLRPGSDGTQIIKISTAVFPEVATTLGYFTVDISTNLTVQRLSRVLIGRLSSNKTLTTTINILMPLPNVLLPVLAATVGAFTLVGVLVGALARCGFFRRDKRDAVRNGRVLEVSQELENTIAKEKEAKEADNMYDNHTIKT